MCACVCVCVCVLCVCVAMQYCISTLYWKESAGFGYCSQAKIGTTAEFRPFDERRFSIEGTHNPCISFLWCSAHDVGELIHLCSGLHQAFRHVDKCKGIGVRTMEHITHGAYVCEYRGIDYCGKSLKAMETHYDLLEVELAKNSSISDRSWFQFYYTHNGIVHWYTF